MQRIASIFSEVIAVAMEDSESQGIVMKPSKRVVTLMPLTAIWNREGELKAERVRELGVDDIKSVLRNGTTQFVVADVGKPLDWIDQTLSFEFWDKTVKHRLVEPGLEGFALEDFPGEYCYCATLWKTQELVDIIVLETCH